MVAGIRCECEGQLPKWSRVKVSHSVEKLGRTLIMTSRLARNACWDRWSRRRSLRTLRWAVECALVFEQTLDWLPLVVMVPELGL